VGNKPNTEAEALREDLAEAYADGVPAGGIHEVPEQPEFHYRYTTTPANMTSVEPLPTKEEVAQMLAVLRQAHKPPLGMRASRALGTAVVICGLLLVLFGIALAAYALYSWVVG